MKKEYFAIILTLIKKNIRLLIRAKTSALIVILGPLFIIFLAGIAFDNTNLYAMKIGTYSEKYNDLSNSFIDKLSEKNFKVTRFPEIERCTRGIEKGEVHTCVVFSPDFKIAQNGSNALTFYVDYSQINLVWTVLNTMTESVESRSTELSKNLTTILIDALEYSSKQVQDKKPSLIALATASDESSRRITDVSVRLEEVDLRFDPNSVGASDLSSSKNKVKHWLDASINLGNEAVGDAQSFVGSADDAVQGSSISADTKESLRNSFQSTIAELQDIEDRMEDVENLAGEQFNELAETINTVVGKITQTKAQLDQAASEKDVSLAELSAVKSALDGSLKNLIDVQRSLNNIENMISGIEVKDPESVSQPIVTKILPLVAEKSYLNYLFPTLIVLIIMFTAILLAPTLIMLEKNSAAHFRNFMAPIKDSAFILATFCTCFCLLGVQLLIILAIASVFFTSQLLNSIISTLVLSILIITMFTSLGMIIGYLFKSEETATLAAISVGSLLLFTSDVIIPIESMPNYLGMIAEFNPFVVSADLLRSSIVYNISFLGAGTKILVLLFFCVLFSVLAVLAFSSAKRHTLSKYISKFGPMFKRKKQ